jgi:hypothetical protein
MRDLVAEKERLAHLPRILTRDEQAEIAEKLKPLALIPDPEGIPERADIDVFPESSEAQSLARQINETMTAAGWSTAGISGSALLGGDVRRGVVVFIEPQSEKSRLCGAALAAALNETGIAASTDPDPIAEIVSDNCVRMARIKTDPFCSHIFILVGEHP